MGFENISLEKSGEIATLTLDHPPGNVLSLSMLSDLANIFSEVESERAIRAVVLTGAGDRFFCAGADIREFRSMDANEFSERGQLLFRRVETFAKPIIAAINGAAFGGGCELAVSCHLRIAADHARFGHQEVTYGFTPAWGATQRLPRLIGRTRALEMLLTARALDAHRAEQIGLVNHVVPLPNLLQVATEFARQIASAAPLAVRAILESVDTGLKEGLEQGLESERENFGWNYQTDDAHAGLAAFFNKQKPEFKGR